MSEKPKYKTVSTDTGTWLHAPGSDFLFAFLMNDWPPQVTNAVTAAFQNALSISSAIKGAVLETSGQSAVNGLYLLDQVAMTEAMNSISGMGETSADQQGQQGSGTAADINQQFFAAILAGLGGDVTPITSYLNQEMSNLQAQTGQSTVTENFGTVIGLVSVMPVLNVPVTTFQYVYSSEATSSWFVKLNCASAEQSSYDYSYTVVNYNYESS